MNILHLSDIHIQETNHLNQEILSIFEQQIFPVIKKTKSVVTITGDIFDSSNINIGSEGVEILNTIIKQMSNIADKIIIIRGTITHDAPNSLNYLKYFNTNIYVVEKPEIIEIDKTIFFCLPGAYGLSYQHLNDEKIKLNSIRDLIIKQLQLWSQYSKTNKYKILLAHLTIDNPNIAGFQKEFEDLYYEPVIEKKVIQQNINPDLILLGHIHNVIHDENYRYAGSLIQLSFSEANIYEITNSQILPKYHNIKQGFYVYNTELNVNQFYPIYQNYEKIIIEVKNNISNFSKILNNFLENKSKKYKKIDIRFDLYIDDKEIKNTIQQIIQKYNNIVVNAFFKLYYHKQGIQHEKRYQVINDIVSSDATQQLKIWIKTKYPSIKENMIDSICQKTIGLNI